MSAMLFSGSQGNGIAPMGCSYRSSEFLHANKNAGACAPAFS